MFEMSSNMRENNTWTNGMDISEQFPSTNVPRKGLSQPTQSYATLPSENKPKISLHTVY